MPFVFSLILRDGGYRLHGQGTGNKEATSAAFEEIKKMSADDIATLVALTKKTR